MRKNFLLPFQIPLFLSVTSLAFFYKRQMRIQRRECNKYCGLNAYLQIRPGTPAAHGDLLFEHFRPKNIKKYIDNLLSKAKSY
jgi:hypothetical protein